jgi:hypothetical protein
MLKVNPRTAPGWRAIWYRPGNPRKAAAPKGA